MMEVRIDEAMLWKVLIVYVLASALGAAATGFFQAAGRDIGRAIAYRLQAAALTRRAIEQARDLKERLVRVRAVLVGLGRKT